MALTVTGKILGAVALGVSSLLNTGCSSKPTTVYDPVHVMIAADTEGKGILTQSAARKYIYDHYKTIYMRPRGTPNEVRLTKEGLERARVDGTKAMDFMPKHAETFLAAVDEWEKELGFEKQK